MFSVLTFRKAKAEGSEEVELSASALDGEQPGFHAECESGDSDQ